LRAVHTNLLKVTRVHNGHSYDYPAQIQESIAGLSSSVQSHIQNLTLSPAERAQLESQNQAQQQIPQPKTLSHAVSRAAVAVSCLDISSIEKVRVLINKFLFCGDLER
jgi:hypothetical protein